MEAVPGPHPILLASLEAPLAPRPPKPCLFPDKAPRAVGIAGELFCFRAGVGDTPRPQPWATALPHGLPPHACWSRWELGLLCALGLRPPRPPDWPSVVAFVNAISRAVHAQGLGAKV